MDQLHSSYCTVSTAASGAYHHASVVPERFSGTSRSVPGQSIVPAEYQGTSVPPIAKTLIVEATPEAPSTEQPDVEQPEQPAD